VLAECPGAGRTIFEYRSGSRSAKEFEQLADDLMQARNE
jgi:chromosome partitioning protein